MLIKKYNLFILCLNLLFLFSCTQKNIPLPKTGTIYGPELVEMEAEFEEGKKQLFHILSANLKYPSEALQKNIQGKVIIRFVVEDNGTISNFEILKDIGGGCAEEIIRVLQKTQARWNSAKINNKRVRSYYVLTAIFRMPTDNSGPYIQAVPN